MGKSTQRGPAKDILVAVSYITSHDTVRFIPCAAGLGIPYPFYCPLGRHCKQGENKTADKWIRGKKKKRWEDVVLSMQTSLLRQMIMQAVNQCKHRMKFVIHLLHRLDKQFRKTVILLVDNVYYMHHFHIKIFQGITCH